MAERANNKDKVEDSGNKLANTLCHASTWLIGVISQIEIPGENGQSNSPPEEAPIASSGIEYINPSPNKLTAKNAAVAKISVIFFLSNCEKKLFIN